MVTDALRKTWQKVTKLATKQNRLPLVGLLVLGLSACGATQNVKPTTPHSPHSLHSTEAQVELPRQEMTRDVLFDILLGEIAGRRGELEVTLHALSRAAVKTRDPRLAQRATQAALYIKRYPEALQAAQLWVELQPQDLEANESLASVLLGMDRATEAQQYFEKILVLAQEQDQQEQAFLRIASILGQHNNRDAAFDTMQQLVQNHPDDANAFFALSHLAVRAGEMDKAATAIDQALELRPDWQDAALFKARILSSQNEVEQARQFFAKYVKRHPRATKVRLHYARLLVDLKQWELARKEFKRVVKYAPEDGDAILAVGLLALQVNRLDEAEEYLQRHLSLRPQNDQARLYLGQVAEQRRDYAAAASWYRQITADNYYFEAQTRLGVMLAKGGDIEAGRAQLHSINVTDDKQRVQVVLAEEQILRDARDFPEAYKVLSQALKKLPGHKDILYARALVAEKLDKIDVVEKDLRTILKQDPKNVNALNALGYTLADRTDRHEEAMGLLRQALDQKPDDPFILDSMGWLQYRMGNYDVALEYLRKALAGRADAEISAHLGEVLWVVGERNKAKSVWRRALKQTPDNESLLGTIKKFKCETCND